MRSFSSTRCKSGPSSSVDATVLEISSTVESARIGHPTLQLLKGALALGDVADHREDVRAAAEPKRRPRISQRLRPPSSRTHSARALISSLLLARVRKVSKGWEIVEVQVLSRVGDDQRLLAVSGEA